MALLLLAATAVGAALDRVAGTGPLALAAGTGIGAVAASAVFTSAILGRYARLAPPDPEEDAER